MQQRTLLVLALLATPAAASSASSAANAWLESHKSPTDDQLGELQQANPAAFALVNALLKKHPNGMAKLAPEQRGPDVFRAMMTPRHLSAAQPNLALPYATSEVAQVRAPVVDQRSYNVKATSDRDESAVDRLLSAVATMGGAKGKKIGLLNKKRHNKQASENALENDANLFSEEAPAKPVPVQAIEQRAAQAIEVPQVQAQEPAVAAKRENSYLKGIDLSGDMPEVVSVKHGGHKHMAPIDDGVNSLATFSFGDAAPTTPAPKKVEKPKPKKDSSFLKWLYHVKKAPTPEEKPVTPAQTPAKKENSYLAGINFLG